jgi:hypothetical protein
MAPAPQQPHSGEACPEQGKRPGLGDCGGENAGIKEPNRVSFGLVPLPTWNTSKASVA